MFDKILENAQAEYEKSHPKDELDYIGENGLLYCHKCKTPKQVEVEIGGKTIRPLCLCKCEAEKLAAERVRDRQRAFAEKVKTLRRMCFNGGACERWTFDNDDGENPQYTSVMKNYVEHFNELAGQGTGLLLYGEVGRGKSYYACCIANALVDKGYKCYVTDFATILNDLQGNFEKQDYIDELCSANLLIIDDLDIERDTRFGLEQIYNVINTRYKTGLPFLVTTNLTMDKLKNPKDLNYQRIYERILERCHPIEIKGTNHRRKNIRQDYQKTHDLLYGE